MEFLKRHRWWFGIFATVLIFLVCLSLTAAPADFRPHQTIIVAKGSTVSRVATLLADSRIISHPLVLQYILRLSGKSSRVHAGVYLFEGPQNVLIIANRLVTGDYGVPPIQMTFPEGITVRDISEIVSKEIPTLSPQDILLLGKSQEGYLFPDTYLFSPDVTTEAILKIMSVNFNVKMSALLAEVQTSGHSLSDIITVASLVEKEARTDENRRIIAGILWDRLALGMPLQVDAVFGYIFNRDTYSPSLTDLKVDSPYNTYTHKGLPPGPICNPGLGSIEAVLHPTKTKYLYYLTDKDGVMHYAVTYAAHQANQRKYLH